MASLRLPLRSTVPRKKVDYLPFRLVTISIGPPDSEYQWDIPAESLARTSDYFKTALECGSKKPFELLHLTDGEFEAVKLFLGYADNRHLLSLQAMRTRDGILDLVLLRDMAPAAFMSPKDEMQVSVSDIAAWEGIKHEFGLTSRLTVQQKRTDIPTDVMTYLKLHTFCVQYEVDELANEALTSIQKCLQCVHWIDPRWYGPLIRYAYAFTPALNPMRGMLCEFLATFAQTSSLDDTDDLPLLLERDESENRIWQSSAIGDWIYNHARRMRKHRDHDGLQSETNGFSAAPTETRRIWLEEYTKGMTSDDEHAFFLDMETAMATIKAQGGSTLGLEMDG